MTMASEKSTNREGATKSPFALPAMADAYPLDPSERHTVDELLKQLERERNNGDANASADEVETR